MDILNPPNPPAPATQETLYTPTVEDKKLFCASPELFMAESATKAELLISSITDPAIRRRIRMNCNGDAR